MRMIVQHITEQIADTALVNQLAKSSATTTSFPASDNVSSQAVMPLSSEEPMGAQIIPEPTKAEEAAMW
jgi:hypothetical protein